MTDYRVTVKVRNARLLRAIENAGYTSIPKFANDAGVSYESFRKIRSRLHHMKVHGLEFA